MKSTQETKPGLVTTHDLQPRNGMGLRLQPQSLNGVLILPKLWQKQNQEQSSGRK